MIKSFLKAKKAEIFLGVGSLFLALLMVEAYVRFAIPTDEYKPLDLHQEKQRFEYTGSIFSRHAFPRKQQDVNLLDGRKLFVNSLGYRGEEFSFEKPEGITRVVIYGGSAVFDVEATRGEDWPQLVEQILHDRGLNNVEVINAGIPGHASFDSLGRLFSEGHYLSPDFVLIYNTWNDLKYFRSVQPLLRAFEPYNPENAGKHPLLKTINPVDSFLCSWSKLYLYVRTFYYLKQSGVGIEGTNALGEVEGEADLVPSQLRQFALSFESFISLARSIDAEPILVTQAHLASTENTNGDIELLESAFRYSQFGHKKLVSAFEKASSIIREVAKDQNVLLLDASKRLSGKSNFFVDHVHLSTDGSKELASFIADSLEVTIRKAQNR